jgi:hypothetical protein
LQELKSGSIRIDKVDALGNQVVDRPGDGYVVSLQGGLMAHFIIRSDVGSFPANSIEMLKIRVAEILAIIELNKTSKTKVFAQSLATNAARPVQAAGQMVMHPVDTVTGLPAGVGTHGPQGSVTL